MTFDVPLAHAEQSQDLQRELDSFSALTEFRGLRVYVLQADEAPITMNEVGRIREATFRQAGAGRNLTRDTDARDFGPASYLQLVVWDPNRLQIVALYRFKPGRDAMANIEVLRTAQLFDYSDFFSSRVLKQSIELGRSVVNHEAGAARFGFFALWAGLNALLAQRKEVNYFFGNVSLYKSLGPEALDIIITFCQQLYAPPEPLMTAKPGLNYQTQARLDFTAATSLNDRPRIQYLQQQLAATGNQIPRILQSYLSLGSHIWFGDAALDDDFADAYELSIIVPVAKINPQLRQKLT
ncbi:hypothetical protein CWE09_13860 [Aliidiomarina minuta]|uniref:L-ornithine N(alpha)-acyltransferase n=1 Tax=Aliidiomarina minuta TaxID=880057 RepID=A0A432W1A5_9GAMM|nr:GNAT family N-acetyltransferase [Aliidiomarina minuta]RUO23012.1 hypothetical protein CWE09_13860 [Aliidiomarina minuta]